MDGQIINRNEIHKYIDWLKSEIEKCLECDLPFVHIEKELGYYNKLLHNQPQSEKTPVSSLNCLLKESDHILVYFSGFCMALWTLFYSKTVTLWGWDNWII